MKSPQQGMALIEALVASAVLGIGLLGATQLTVKALETASQTRQRGVARLLAQEAMDCAIARSLCPAQDSTEVQGIHYLRQTRITGGGDGLQDIEVTVQWVSVSASASALGGTSAAEPTRLVWHSSVSQLPGWVGR